LPAMPPLVHTLYEVLGVAGKPHFQPLSLARQDSQRLNRTAKGHAIVGRRGLGDPVVQQRHRFRLRMTVLDQPTGPAWIRAFAAISETRLVSVNQDDRLTRRLHRDT